MVLPRPAGGPWSDAPGRSWLDAAETIARVTACGHSGFVIAQPPAAQSFRTARRTIKGFKATGNKTRGGPDHPAAYQEFATRPVRTTISRYDPGSLTAFKNGSIGTTA